MPTLQDLRARLPLLEGLDDESAVLAIQQAYYPSVPVEAVAQRLGYTPPKPADQPLPERSMLAAINDTVIEAGNAVAGGVGSVANFVAPGNAVSSFIDENIVRPGKENQSDRKKAIDARLAADLAGAEGVGDELAAVGRYAASDPLGVIGQAAGSFVIPGAAVKGAGMLSRAVGLGGRATGAGMAGGAAAGAALSGGDAAGQAYEESLQAGATEDQAQAAARQASMIPAAVGAAGGMFGAERLLAGGRGFAGGAASRAIKSGLSEGAQEAIEEGVTQFEANRAVAPFDGRDPTKGVAAAGMLGALMGGPTGAAVSLMTPEPPKLPRLDKKAPSLAESLTKIAEAPTVDDAIKAMGDALDPAAKPEPAAAGGGLDRLRTILPDEQRREVLGLMATAGNPNSPPNVRRYAENRIDAIIREYTDIPVADVIEEADMLPTGEARELTDAERADFVNARRFSDERRIARGIPTGEATEVLPVGDATEVEPIPVGDAAEAIPAGEAFETLPVGEATEAIPTGEATELPKRIPTGTATELTPEVIEPASELKTRDGMPYGSLAGAKIRARKEGGVVVPVQGGWVVRVADRVDGQTSTVDGSTDGSPADAEKRSDLPRGKSEFEQRFASLDAPRKRVVLSSVVRSIKDSQVLQRVVQAIPVDVMNVLARQQGTPQGLLDNESVLKNALAVDAKNAVSADIDKAIASVVRAVAGVATELRFAGSGADAISNETRSALDAVERLVSGEVATSASAGAEQTASLGVGNVPVGFGDRGSTPRTLDNRQVSTPTSIGELGTSAVAPTDVPPTLSATEPDINTMSREAYAEARQRQYVEKRGGSVPDKVAASVYGNALRQWDQKHPPTPAPQGGEVRTPADVSPAAPAIDTSPQRVEAPAEDQQKPMGFRQAEREAKRLTDETGNPHKAVQRERVDEEGYTVSEWYAEPVEAKRGMSLEEAKAYQEQANRERPLGRTWEDLERMQGGKLTDKPATATNDTAAKLQARQDRKAKADRDEPTIELRKRLSVLKALKECIG